MSTHHIGRYDDAIEDAVYFTCREAIQNVLKHAPEATAVTLRLADENGQLRFEVRDDGRGLVDEARPRGRGIASMRHRIASVGGHLTVRAAPGGGTLVRCRVPLDGPVTAPSSNADAWLLLPCDSDAEPAAHGTAGCGPAPTAATAG